MKVLVADDDAITRRMVEVILQKWGHDVVVAEDGDRAWQVLQEEDSPQMAILDWQMPGIDGVDVCRRLRSQTNRPYVYVVLLTALDTPQGLVEGADAGADDYLIKPFDPPRLKMRVNAGLRILNLQSQLLESVERYKSADAELEKARLREVQAGAKIQKTLLLGQAPHGLKGAKIAALTSPSEMIDGDFYDFFVHNEHCFDVIVGDVMGKGVPGALVGAAVKSHIQKALGKLIYADNGQLPEPEDIINFVHKNVTKELINLETFTTLCYARLDNSKMKFTLVDCGHTATIHFKPGNAEPQLLKGDNMPLGFSEIEHYKQLVLTFEPGDLFLFYSDGITEAQRVCGELFGVDRLCELIQKNSVLEPQKLIERVRTAVIAFTHSRTFADDLTCVAVKIDEAPTSAPLVHSEIVVPSELRQLQKIRAFVTESLGHKEGARFDEESHYKLLIAVNEAASNIIRHAYKDLPDGIIAVTSDLFADRIVIRLSHSGTSFDPTDVRPPSFDGTRDGGFGVYMIEQCVDEVQYSSAHDGKSTIRIVKRKGTV